MSNERPKLELVPEPPPSLESGRWTLAHRKALAIGATALTVAGATAGILWNREGSNHRALSISGLAAHGESLPNHIYTEGETIDWPFPIHIRNWSLIIEDRPAIEAAHDLRPVGSTTNILSNNILRDNSRSNDRGHNNLSLSDSTTMDDDVSVMRIRPALTTEQAPDADKITMDFTAPFVGYSSPEKAPHYQYKVAYHPTWYRGQEEENSLVDPAKETVISETPLDTGWYKKLDRLVRQRRLVTLGEPLVAIPKYRVNGEFNTEEESGIITMNSFYLHSDPRLLNLLLNHELNHPIISGAKQNIHTIDALLALRHIHLRLAKQQDKYYTSVNPTSLTCEDNYTRIFKLFDESTYYDPGQCEIGHPDQIMEELFASGLNVMRLYPREFTQFFHGLKPTEQTEARQVRDDIIRILEETIKAKGESPAVLDEFWPERKFLEKL